MLYKSVGIFLRQQADANTWKKEVVIVYDSGHNLVRCTLKYDVKYPFINTMSYSKYVYLYLFEIGCYFSQWCMLK